MLFILEDNEAVIKMIIQGKSPIMRHASRTHRVALDWLFDRIKLDPKIQTWCIDNKHQLADILTKWNITRDEWNHLLYLCNISHFSSTCCAKNSSLISCPNTMAKRMQEQKGEERSVATSKSTAMKLSSSSTVRSPIPSRSPGILKASSRSDWIVPRKNQDALKDSIKTQCRVLKDGKKMQFWTHARGEFSRRT